MAETESSRRPAWLDVGGQPPSGADPVLTVSSYLVSRLGSPAWLPPPPIEDEPLTSSCDDDGSDPSTVGLPGRYIDRERQGAPTAVRAVLTAARSDPGLARRLHAPMPLGRRPTILLDLAVNIVTAAERAAPEGSHAGIALLNRAVDALGMADGYAEASAVRQHRRRWLGPGLLVAAAAAGEADARWLELGFLAEAAPRLAPCARAWQVARMPSRADALIEVVMELSGRLDHLCGSAPSRQPARALAAAGKQALRISLGNDGEGPDRLLELAAATGPAQRERLLTFSTSMQEGAS